MITNRTLCCEHMGCPNGCTTRSGMCEACVRIVLDDQARVMAGLAFLQERGLYDIHFRNAGVGLTFFEPPEWKELTNMPEWKQHLKTHRYYPSLVEAVNGEYERVKVLSPATEPPHAT